MLRMLESILRMIRRTSRIPCGRCPVCGRRMKSRIRRPLGGLVTDGPSFIEVRCGRCGYKFRVPIHVGP